MTKKREFLIFFSLLGFAFVCYATTIPNYFLSDDFDLIGGVARHGVTVNWGLPAAFFRPGASLSYLIDHLVWGLNPVGYHVTNILFHGLGGFMLFLIARRFFSRLGLDQPHTASFLAAALFVAMSSHSESVSWIAGRTDVIAVALALTGTFFFMSLLESRSTVNAVMSLLFLASALLTKEAVIALPFVWGALYLHEWYGRRERPGAGSFVAGNSRSFVVLVASFVILAAYFLVRKMAIGTFIGGYGNTWHISSEPSSIFDNLTKYLFRTFCPPLPFSRSGAQLILLALIGLITLAFSLRRKETRAIRWPFVGLLAICYLLSLAPVITMYVNIYDTQGERFLYLPGVFACLLLVYGVWTFTSQMRLRIAFLAALIVIQAALLQWINTRWITASQLTRQIAGEVAPRDPARTAILNLPDNFRGAYVFRNGLNEAATFFLGREPKGSYRTARLHDVMASDHRFEVSLDSTSLVLTLPENTRSEVGFLVKRTRALIILDRSGAFAGADSLLSFTSASSEPLMQATMWQTGPIDREAVAAQER